MTEASPSGFPPEQEPFVTEVVAHICRRYAAYNLNQALQIRSLTKEIDYSRSPKSRHDQSALCSMSVFAVT
jgi:hypothetical protein